MTTALEAAKYLIQLAAREPDEPEPMTSMRVQKLLYYAQGWHVGLFNRPLFTDSIQAWKSGPVVPGVYETVRAAVGAEPARPLTMADFGPTELSGRDQVFLEVVWRKYRTLSTAGLREATHAETPWVAARGNTRDGERSSAEISIESLRSYFGSQPEARLADPRELEDVYEGEAASREQPPVSFEELRRRRRAVTHPGKQPL
jgi:uncharacterized phage-associated protein